MKCPQCQTDISDDSRFCSKCGTPVSAGERIVFSKTQTILRPMEELSPETLLAGKYRLLKIVGRGGMGIVYKAEDTKLKRWVALKFLPPELVQSPEARERFANEARAAASLCHPNICTIYEIHDEGEKPFIAMEFIEGQSLKASVAKNPLSIEKTLDLAVQVSEGLEEAHKKGIIHRDIKSANIMVTDKGQAKVMDFGLAKVKGGTLLTREGTTLGTVAYMSPEQALGRDLDQRTDIWSLGVVLYEMLSGRLPFTGDHEASILYTVVHEEPKPLKAVKPDIGPELRQIVSHALKKNPEARYGSAAEMGKDIRKFQDSQRAGEMKAFSLPSFLRWLRKPMVAIPAALAFIALIPAAAWFLNRVSKIRWAKETGLPRLQRLFESDDYSAALDLALRIEEYIPGDAQLSEILPEIERYFSVQTDPSQADVFVKDYRNQEKDWVFIGKTPLAKVRISKEFKRWKIVKDGYEPVEGSDNLSLVAEPTRKVDSLDLRIRLDRKGDMPADMVRVPEAETEVGKLDEFLMDRFEVTNRAYKEFMNKAGYQNKKFWKHEFIKDGRVLSWEEAMAEFVDSTGRPGPSTWSFGDYPEDQEDYPVAGVSWYEAAAFAEFTGKTLPTVYHWMNAAGPMNSPFIIPLSNFSEKGIEPVGRHQGMSPFGTYDMAGNIKEWVWNESEGKRYNLGGAWNEPQYLFYDLELLPPMIRTENIGFRCIKSISPDILPAALQPVARSPQRNIAAEKPCAEEVFTVLKSHYYYDKRSLDPRVESRDETPRDWILEKVSYDAGYPGERMISYIFLPKNSRPPFQTIIYFPGGAASSLDSILDYHIKRYDIFIKGGRAFVFPVFYGTFERKGSGRASGRMPAAFRDGVVREYKEFARTIDYLETRPEFDKENLVYHGLSWGASQEGFIFPALEQKRLKAVVLLCGGFSRNPEILPEVNPVNFAPRLKIPVIMLNGIYDEIFPFETNSKIAFQLLGTPEKDKFLKAYESSHYMLTMNIWVKETLDFLDRYLGPVR